MQFKVKYLLFKNGNSLFYVKFYFSVFYFVN